MADFDAFARVTDEFLSMVNDEFPVKGSDLESAGISAAASFDGDMVVQYSAGVCDPPGTPVDDNTVFRIASISKPVTAAAILLLIQQDELALTTEVFDVLGSTYPPIPGADIEALKRITVLDLLHHSSG